jgi:hypothetical protein
LQVFLNRLRVIHDLSELDALEVFNAVGASLLKEALEPAAVGTATVIPQDQHRRLKDDDTGIIPAIAVDRMGYSQVPRKPGEKMKSRYPRTVGNDTAALHD